MPIRLKVIPTDEPEGRAYQYEFDSDRSQILIGRRSGVDVLLPDRRVSLIHSRIDRRSGEYYLCDEGSSNGTRLNGFILKTGEPLRLRAGDRVSLGGFTLEVDLRLTEMNARLEHSTSMTRRMVLGILERLGPGESQPHLTVLDGPQQGARFSVGEAGRTYFLGRGSQGELRLEGIDVAHGLVGLVRDEMGVTAREMSAKVSLNEKVIGGARALVDGDLLKIDGIRLRYSDPAEVYLKKLEGGEVAENPYRKEARREGRGEMVLLTAAVLTVLLSALGLWYVISWR